MVTIIRHDRTGHTETTYDILAEAEAVARKAEAKGSRIGTTVDGDVTLLPPNTPLAENGKYWILAPIAGG